MIKEKGVPFGVGGLVGAVVVALLNTNLFMTQAQGQEVKTEIQALRAEVAEKYIKRDEVDKRLERIENLVTKLVYRYEKDAAR